MKVKLTKAQREALKAERERVKMEAKAKREAEETREEVCVLLCNNIESGFTQNNNFLFFLILIVQNEALGKRVLFEKSNQCSL